MIQVVEIGHGRHEYKQHDRTAHAQHTTMLRSYGSLRNLRAQQYTTTHANDDEVDFNEALMC